MLPSGCRRSVDSGNSASLSSHTLAPLPVAWISSHTARLMPISTNEVIRGSATRCPPYGVRVWRLPRLASLTQFGQWKPTAALFMQSGQIGRSQRWHLIQVSRSVCR